VGVEAELRGELDGEHDAGKGRIARGEPAREQRRREAREGGCQRAWLRVARRRRVQREQQRLADHWAATAAGEGDAERGLALLSGPSKGAVAA